MKFPKGWQVDVEKVHGAGKYAEVSHDIEIYVVGVPGKPFRVQVTAPPAAFRSAPKISVHLTLDGRFVGQRGFLDERHPSWTFKGFVTIVKGERRLSQFLFGKAQDASDSSGAAGSPYSHIGRLEVVAKHVQPRGLEVERRHSPSPAALPSRAAVVEGALCQKRALDNPKEQPCSKHFKQMHSGRPPRNISESSPTLPSCKQIAAHGCT